tara:strand:- start:505 stop:723 length:219 start_codon:yes stop_codon:yes gene_type:complete
MENVSKIVEDNFFKWSSVDDIEKIIRDTYGDQLSATELEDAVTKARKEFFTIENDWISFNHHIQQLEYGSML